MIIYVIYYTAVFYEQSRLAAAHNIGIPCEFGVGIYYNNVVRRVLIPQPTGIWYNIIIICTQQLRVVDETNLSSR